MRKLLLILLLVLLRTLVSLAQDEEHTNGSFSIVNNSGEAIDTTAVEQAAQNLVNQYRADVVIYVFANGNSDTFTQELSAAGLGGDFSANAWTLAIFVATAQPYSEIRLGSNFDRINVDDLRTNALNPLLRESNFTQAFVNTLTTVNQQMSNPAYGAGYYLRFIVTSPFFWAALAVAAVAYLLIRLGLTRSDRKDIAPKPASTTLKRYGANTTTRQPGGSDSTRKA